MERMSGLRRPGITYDLDRVRIKVDFLYSLLKATELGYFFNREILDLVADITKELDALEKECR
ncbi:hypothetical protein ACH0B5_07245 [Ureibacillus sp. 179-F W5.1 NHS]|uniref:hypothetical protein n=1 Tax=Ureibacillus sp. 179-F W5.1 NHS TaxID=3374297 RepID=UPI00387A811F